MALVRTPLVLMMTFLLAAGGTALAHHQAGFCGPPSPEGPFGGEEFIDIGSRFAVRNVTIASSLDGVVVAGQVYNGHQGFFTPPLFKVRLFDPNCTYLRANNFTIDNFRLGTIRPFQVIVPGVEFDNVATYHLEYLGWSGN